MAKTYREEASKRFIQPLFQRLRAIYKGPRQSQKENLEMNKFLVDVSFLDEKADNLNNSVYDNVRIFVNQNDPEKSPIHDLGDDGYYYTFMDVREHMWHATPSYVELDTTFTIQGKLDKMMQKIKVLEDKKLRNNT